MTVDRAFSGIQPTGGVHLGNYLGALRQWSRDQYSFESIYCIVDLHAITVPADPKLLRANTLDMAQTLLAVGLDPAVCTLIIQSHLADLHNRLAWLLTCNTGMGELRRMTQFKEKSERVDEASVGLFTYPTLMAADIVMYDATRVPVGDDQRQHVELAREIVRRMNSRYGEILTLPEAVMPPRGARVRDLRDPSKKMSKSDTTGNGVIFLFESPESIERKILRATTDSGEGVASVTGISEGVENLLTLLAAATDSDVEKIADSYSSYRDLKVDTAEAIVEMLRPIQERRRELEDDPGEVLRIFGVGAEKARVIASTTVGRVSKAMGLLAAPSLS